MVDQLWLWVLDNSKYCTVAWSIQTHFPNNSKIDTIVTCFPENWSTGLVEEHSMDIIKNIQEELSFPNRYRLRSVHGLAQFIVYSCLSVFCRDSTPMAQCESSMYTQVLSQQW